MVGAGSYGLLGVAVAAVAMGLGSVACSAGGGADQPGRRDTAATGGSGLGGGNNGGDATTGSQTSTGGQAGAAGIVIPYGASMLPAFPTAMQGDPLGACIIYATAWMRRVGRCHVPPGAESPPISVDDPVAQAETCPDLLFSEGSTRTIESVLACADAIEMQDCADYFAGVQPDCIAPGTKALDEPCSFSSQCESLVCDGLVVHDKLFSWPCPRCGKPYCGGVSPFNLRVPRTCAACGLPRGTESWPDEERT